jgi:GxxExxY protein
MKERLDAFTDRVIGAAIAVHRKLGPGMLESSYQACLAFELMQRGLEFEHQKALPVVYRGTTLDCGYRVNFLVEGQIIVELKAIQRLEPVHVAQVISYLRMSGCRVGLLINFNVKWLTKQGLRRIVNDFPDS